MSLIIRISNLVTVVVTFVVLIRTSDGTTERDLAKIFRTPRDFDHMEILERAGFDPTESTSSPPSTDKPISKSKKKNRNNYANAQVSVKFGADYGSNHVMKIPPQCRHLIGSDMNHPPIPIPNPNFYYPPPCHRIPLPGPPHQFYHPYPPPVPYIFPNYYFWTPGVEPTYLPPQLNEYFRRHPDFLVTKCPYNDDVFTRGRPIREGEVKKILVPADAKVIPVKNIEDLNELPGIRPQDKIPLNLIRSRILTPLDLTSEINEEANKEMKRDCSILHKENDDEVGNNISMEFSDSAEESPHQIYNPEDKVDNNEPVVPENHASDPDGLKILESSSEDAQDRTKDPKSLQPSTEENQQQPDVLSVPNISDTSRNEVNNELEKLLIQSLVETSQNSSSSSKMLVSYPVINRGDTLSQESKPVLQASSYPYYSSSKQEKFGDAIDSLRSLKTKDILDDEHPYKTRQCDNNITNMASPKNFIKDIDDLVAVLIEVIDVGDGLPSIPKPKRPSFPEIIDSILKPCLPDFISLFSTVFPTPPPLAAMLNLALGDYGLSNTYGRSSDPSVASSASQCESSNPRIRVTQQDCSCSPDDTYTSESTSIILLHNSPEEKKNGVASSVAPQITNRIRPDLLTKEKRYRKILPVEVEVQPSNIVPIPVKKAYQNVQYIKDIYPPSSRAISSNVLESLLPLTKPFPPEANLIPKEGYVPKYVQIIPRPDLELVPLKQDVPSGVAYSNIAADAPPPRDPDSVYCRKCGRKHIGGYYCDKCGYPLIVYQGPLDPFCATCTKEVRQLNDW